jgi:hypothetical protein
MIFALLNPLYESFSNIPSLALVANIHKKFKPALEQVSSGMLRDVSTIASKKEK